MDQKQSTKQPNVMKHLITSTLFLEIRCKTSV